VNCITYEKAAASEGLRRKGVPPQVRASPFKAVKGEKLKKKDHLTFSLKNKGQLISRLREC